MACLPRHQVAQPTVYCPSSSVHHLPVRSGQGTLCALEAPVQASLSALVSFTSSNTVSGRASRLCSATSLSSPWPRVRLTSSLDGCCLPLHLRPDPCCLLLAIAYSSHGGLQNCVRRSAGVEKARRNDSTPSFHPATGEADTSISQDMRIFLRTIYMYLRYIIYYIYVCIISMCIYSRYIFACCLFCSRNAADIFALPS